MVADGAGGMVPVQDRRFEAVGDWPIRFEIRGERADTWLRYFNAECTNRGWSSGGIGQLDASENSGSITVTTGAANPTLAVVWSESVASRYVCGLVLAEPQSSLSKRLKSYSTGSTNVATMDGSL